MSACRSGSGDRPHCPADRGRRRAAGVRHRARRTSAFPPRNETLRVPAGARGALSRRRSDGCRRRPPWTSKATSCGSQEYIRYRLERLLATRRRPSGCCSRSTGSGFSRPAETRFRSDSGSGVRRTAPRNQEPGNLGTVVPRKRHEPTASGSIDAGRRRPCAAQQLLIAPPDRDDQAAADFQLIDERLRQMIRRGGHDDRVERGRSGQPE